MNHLEKMAKARAIAVFKAPYFSSGVHSLVPHPVPGVGTMAVTKGSVLYYDPEFLEAQSEDYLADALLHEVLHVYFRHAEREDAINADPDTFNIAGDLAINSLLEEMGIVHKEKGASWLYPQAYNFPVKQTAEFYYTKLLGKEQKKNDKNQAGKQQAGVGAGQCGGIAGNPLNQTLEEALDKQSGRDDSEQDLVRTQIQHELQEAVSRGTLPATLMKHVSLEREKAKISWRKVLANLVQKLAGQIEGGGDDFSIAFPSKRSYVRGILRPGMIQHKIFPAFILDTSGSMNTELINAAISEAIGIVGALGADNAWLIQADVEVACEPKQVKIKDLQHAIDVHGRGGTHFDAALQAADRLKPHPDLVFYLTDGEGGVSYVPKIPVVWVIVPQHYNKNRQAPAPWGKTVFVEN